MVGRKLALQAIHRQFEWSDGCRCVVNQHLSNRLNAR
jgi:hypothetical protein